MPAQTAKQHQGRANFHAGEAAEEAVVRDYKTRGYTVAAQRWRGGGGEIDLILRHGQMVVCVEVKKSRSLAIAATRITAAQQQRIMSAASAFIAAEPNGMLTDLRFDVALLNAVGEIEIIENAISET